MTLETKYDWPEFAGSAGAAREKNNWLLARSSGEVNLIIKCSKLSSISRMFRVHFFREKLVSNLSIRLFFWTQSKRRDESRDD